MPARRALLIAVAAFFRCAATPFPAAGLALGPEELVEAGAVVIQVPGYSVPSIADWNNDGRDDLIIGQGGGGIPDGKVRVYLNIGTASNPSFGDFFYAQSAGSDLVSPAEG